MSPQKHRILRKHRKGALSVDLRMPFAITVAEGLLLLGLIALLAYGNAPRLPLLAVCILIFYLVTAGAVLLAYALRFDAYKKAEREAEELSTDISHVFRSASHVPYAVINADGMLRVINHAMQDILGFHASVCRIPLSQICPAITVDWLNETVRRQEAEENDLLSRRVDPIPETVFPGIDSQASCDPNNAAVVRLRDGRRYRMETHLIQKENDHYYLVIFHDVTQLLDLMEEADRTHMVLAYIILDNLQELTQFVRANYRTTAGLIEETLTRWVEGMNGMLREYDRDKYLAIFTTEMLDRCIADNFSILDDIMKIRVGDNSFPLSISMGIADIDGSMNEREKAASAALDMALQRGGNQVALQRRGSTNLLYYGGAHKTLEANTSISSRVSATLLERRLMTCGNVLVMAHSNPDFDAIGSSVGAYRLCRSILEANGRENVPVRVVTNKTCDTFAICSAHLSSLPEYESVFIDKAAAQQSVSSDTLLILTDVNNPYIFEAPGIVGCIASDSSGISNIAVIDHHRQVGELPFRPFLHYIEATKSSASEIVSEILRQSSYAETLHKEEANLLLAGIMLDTHNFTRSAGAQTFDATYYLYSRKAHTDVAREFFNERIDELLIAGDFDAHTRLYADVFAITWLSEDHVPSGGDRIAASKAADKLLSIRGVEASFALALVPEGVSISARSKGNVNVQLIMEKLDGGGHFDMAGAQVPGNVPEAYDRLTAAIDEYTLQFPEQFRKG